ncbi:hypothetical protein [Bacteroides caecigallinarum]|uniref:hypothetical protein n=1 Tax=Bacteroides caecigallinarum TaxID=1411144 RepID=UPI00195B7786|nr:hypothetical protein [Bacteroides caecigallinarum]MBM6884005.1 hypothetical protein [Bacteroides caecigallinarum]
MGKVSYSLVLSDELLSEYYKFTSNSNFDRNLIEKLFNYYKPTYITNKAQLERINHTSDKNLVSSLIKSGLKNQTLEELASKTKYKIILSTDRNDYPYVNINDDNIEKNFTGTFLRNESRDKAIKHIKSLCKEAEKFIIVYDKYFNEKDDNADTLINLLPKHKLEIIYQLNTFSQEQKDKLQKACPTWTLRDENFQDCHDRYLIIDNKVEIILTSGFWYLNNLSKEITYIVRLIKNIRFNN